MRLLNFGGGRIAGAVVDTLVDWDHTILTKDTVDVTDRTAVQGALDRWAADAVLVTAGISTASPAEEIWVNLYGSLVVAHEATRRSLPTVLIASVAGMQGKPGHLGYAASKAGVISVVQSLASEGHDIWCVSPGRVDTPMRERDYPNDPPGSRLAPEEVAKVIDDILHGLYAPGANVVIRKVGLLRVDSYEEPRWTFPSLSS